MFVDWNARGIDIQDFEMTTVTHICPTCDHEFEVEVEYTPAVPGRLYGRSEDCYPQRAGGIELIDTECPSCHATLNEQQIRNDFLERLSDNRI